MALIIEDGSVVVGADSFVSVGNADIYLANFGFTEWAPLDTAVKESLLRQAAQYIKQKYQSRWKGSIADASQTLSWPRVNVWMDNMAEDYELTTGTVPQDVVSAQCELALLAMTGPLFPVDTGEQEVIKQKVDTLEIQYSEGSGSSVPKYTSVDYLLQPYFSTSSSSIGMVERA